VGTGCWHYSCNQLAAQALQWMQWRPLELHWCPLELHWYLLGRQWNLLGRQWCLLGRQGCLLVPRLRRCWICL